MTTETIAISGDHGGIGLKDALAEELADLGYKVLDLGTSGPEPVDYPDYAYSLAESILDGQAWRGVAVCGSGIGISIAANRFLGIRAALVHDSNGARTCRLHNDANVIVFGGLVTEPEVARKCLRIFLETEFEGGRHARRVNKLSRPPGSKQKQ